MSERDLEKAALRGEPSYVWRAGQERRLEMILAAAGERCRAAGVWRTAAEWACMLARLSADPAGR